MALTKYKSKVDSGTGEKNEISLKDVYEWVQSRQLSGGNEEPLGPVGWPI